MTLISETWLTPTDYFNIPGYTIRRKDRTPESGKPHREGVLIAIHLFIPVEDTTTVIGTISLKTKNNPSTIFTAGHTPPNNKITPAELHKFTIKRINKHYITGGDLNAKHQ